MKPLAAHIALTCLVVLILFSPASADTIGVLGDESAPSPELGPHEMTAIDPQDSLTHNLVDYIDSPLGGTVDFSISMQHGIVGVGGWPNWSHDYAGDVYWTRGETSVILQLPAETRAFYFYVQPVAGYIEITATAQGAYSISQYVTYYRGARYFAFYTDGLETIDYIEISAADDFAVGEFAIASEPALQPVQAVVRFSPDKIKLQARNRWITAHLTLPDGYDITQVLTETLLLNDTWQPAGTAVDPDTGALVARFEKTLLEEILLPGTVQLTISGLLDDETPFHATNTVEGIPPNK